MTTANNTGALGLLNNVVRTGASQPPGTQAASQQQNNSISGGFRTVLNRVEPADTKAIVNQAGGGSQATAQQGYSRVGPAVGVNQQGVPIVAGQYTAGQSLVSAVKGGALNPYVSQLHQLFSEPAAGRDGIFVAEGTHYLNTERNNNAEAYDLASVPPQREDLTTFQSAEPRNWLANSYPVQLEQLNSEVYHFDTQTFTNNFVANAPSTISEVVQSNSSGWGDSSQMRHLGMGGLTVASDDPSRDRVLFTNQSNSSAPNTGSSWWDRVNASTIKSGGTDFVRGGMAVGSGYRMLMNPNQAGTQLMNRGQDYMQERLGVNQGNNDVQMQEGENDPYQGDEMPEQGEIPEPADAYEGPGFEGEEGIESAEGVMDTTEGVEAGVEIGDGALAAGEVAEGVGMATAIGATGGTILIAAGVGLAAYGLYEAAVGLGAPTITEDVDAAGNWFKSTANWFGP